jgi:hypothetical protein
MANLGDIKKEAYAKWNEDSETGLLYGLIWRLACEIEELKKRSTQAHDRG